MNDKIYESFADQTKLMFGPLMQINQTFVSQLEKITEFQIESIRSYSEIGLNRLKSAMEVKDLQTGQNFAKNEMEFITNINEKMIEDAKRLADIGNDFKVEFEELLKSNMANSTDAKTNKTKAKATAA